MSRVANTPRPAARVVRISSSRGLRRNADSSSAVSAFSFSFGDCSSVDRSSASASVAGCCSVDTLPDGSSLVVSSTTSPSDVVGCSAGATLAFGSTSKSNPRSSAKPALIRESAVVGVLRDRKLGIKLAFCVKAGGTDDRVDLKLLLGERVTLILDEDALRARVVTGPGMMSVEDGGGTDGAASTLVSTACGSGTADGWVFAA
jgi:hypothetical protein